MGRIYSYDNKNFHSIKDLAKYVNVNEKTLTARLRRGLSIEAACEKSDLRCTYYLDHGKQKSLTQICQEQSKSRELVMNRLKYGYSLHDALNKPKKTSRQGRPIVVHGVFIQFNCFGL